MRVAIYDLDKTLTRRPTFTPFLMYAARRIAPWRLMLAPGWIMAMVGYRAKLYSRTSLKRFGIRLMLGNPGLSRLEEVGSDFARDRIAAGGLAQGALRSLAEERAAGSRVVIATAAFGFYANAFARMLGVDEVVATGWTGSEIPGGNCYGAVKLARVAERLNQLGIARKEATVCFYTDSTADRPLLDWADEGVLVGAGRSIQRVAEKHGWRSANFAR